MEDIGSIQIPLRGKYGNGKFVLVDADYDGEYFSGYKWYVTDHGYAYRRQQDGRIVYLHQEVCRAPRGMYADHINGNKLDNRSCNLRWATPTQNTYNRRQPKRGWKRGSQYRGVGPSMTQEKTGKRYYGKTWTAHCRGKYLGSFPTEIEAARAYDLAAVREYGEYAVLNIA